MPVTAAEKLPEDAVVVETWQPSRQEQDDMAKDHGSLKKFEEYKFPFRQQMIEGIRRYNMKAMPMADRRISNVMIPLVRMVADSCITTMSNGNPSFDIKPRALSDYPKIEILRPAIEQVLEECNYRSEQNNFLRDGTVMGTAALEVYTDMPMRSDEFGRPIRDWERPRIGIRARSGLETSFSPTMRNHNVKGMYHWRDIIDYDTFNADYKLPTLIDGTKKFKHTENVKPGFQYFVSPDGTMLMRPAGLYQHKGYVIDHLQDPLRNFYRIYANGVQIYNIALHMRRNRDGTHTVGDNALGATRLCVWNNNDQYDDNDQTSALYGGSEYWLFKGLDKIYSDFANILVDNWALANTFALTYKPGDINIGGLDLDTTDFYSGMFIGGEIISTPFGTVKLQDFQNIKDVLDEWCIQVTGCNFKGIVGEEGKTAFEVATKIRASNARFQYKLKKLEDTVFKKMGKLVVAAIFTTYTVDDFELVSDQDRATLAAEFADGKIAEDDLLWTKDKKGNQRISGKKIKKMIKVPGIVYKENLGKDQKRVLDGTINNTLGEDVTMRGKGDSFIPAAEEYLVTEAYAEHGMLPDISVDTGSMVTGQEQVALSNLQQLTQYAEARTQQAMQFAQAGDDNMMATDFDMKKIDKRTVELLQFQPDAVMKDTGRNAEADKDMKRIDSTMDQLKQLVSQPPTRPGSIQRPLPPSPNGQPSPAQGAPMAGQQPQQPAMPQMQP